jgi:ferritin-like metal-binding protein YciE
MQTKNMSTHRNQVNKSHKEPDLKELLVKELKDLYNAEKQLVKALPKLSKAASSDTLKQAFEEHLHVTEEHVNRLERIFQELDEKPTGVQCEAMKGLVAEGEKTIKEPENSLMKDLGLIAGAQKVEHYEISGYGTVRTFAEMLGMDEAVTLLQQTLDEEGEADKTLTSISEELLENQKNEGMNQSEESKDSSSEADENEEDQS